MAHEIDNSTGRDAIAYVNATPWHGLGQRLQPGADLSTWQAEAGLDWEAKVATVQYEREAINPLTGALAPHIAVKADSKVIYRSDTGAPLSIMSNRYIPFQPGEVIEFYRDLTERWGFTLETAGALKGGRKIWALASTQHATQLRGNDAVKGFLLLATSYDGSAATQARFTPIRVVCNNTFTLADTGKAEVYIPHSTTFNASAVKETLKIGDAWEAFSAQAAQMSERIVSRDEAVRMLLDVYHGLATPEAIEAAHKENGKTLDKTMERLSNALYNSPGAHMASANGTLWGLINAVTYDVDHAKPARSQENRLDAAWFGNGNALKQRAWERATAMLAA